MLRSGTPERTPVNPVPEPRRTLRPNTCRPRTMSAKLSGSRMISVLAIAEAVATGKKYDDFDADLKIY